MLSSPQHCSLFAFGTQWLFKLDGYFFSCACKKQVTNPQKVCMEILLGLLHSAREENFL